MDPLKRPIEQLVDGVISPPSMLVTVQFGRLRGCGLEMGLARWQPF